MCMYFYLKIVAHFPIKGIIMNCFVKSRNFWQGENYQLIDFLKNVMSSKKPSI